MEANGNRRIFNPIGSISQVVGWMLGEKVRIVSGEMHGTQSWGSPTTFLEDRVDMLREGLRFRISSTCLHHGFHVLHGSLVHGCPNQKCGCDFIRLKIAFLSGYRELWRQLE